MYINNRRCYEGTIAIFDCEGLIERDLHDGHVAMTSMIARGCFVILQFFIIYSATVCARV